MREAILWSVEGDRIRCVLCPNRCLIAPGAVGICGVRRNEAGTLVPLTYGRVSSVAVDPIEKKPVFHYRPGSAVLSLGSVGCSMRCGHCQNWQISRARPDQTGLAMETLEPDAVVQLAHAHGCPGVAFTYNEPVIWAEYVLDVSRACRDAGLFTIMVTNGYITSEGLAAIGDVIDVWRTDLKGATDETYRELCKVKAVSPVMEAAEAAKYTYGMHVEVVTNVVPTVNDSAEELRAMATWIAKSLGEDTPWHITRFFPYLDYSHLPPTPLETLRAARAIGQEAGLLYVYLGNVDEPGGEDTTCPSCGDEVISRRGYSTDSRGLKDGKCGKCGAPLNIIG